MEIKLHTQEVVGKMRIYKASRESVFGGEQVSVPSFLMIILNREIEEV